MRTSVSIHAPTRAQAPARVLGRYDLIEVVGRGATSRVYRALDRATGHMGRGDFALDASGRVSRGGPFVFTGASVIDPAAMSPVTDTKFSQNVVWDRLIAEGRAFGLIHAGGWCDVGQPASIPLAEAMLRAAR